MKVQEPLQKCDITGSKNNIQYVEYNDMNDNQLDASTR